MHLLRYRWNLYHWVTREAHDRSKSRSGGKSWHKYCLRLIVWCCQDIQVQISSIQTGRNAKTGGDAVAWRNLSKEIVTETTELRFLWTQTNSRKLWLKIKEANYRQLLGGPVVRTQHFHLWPAWVWYLVGGNQDPHKDEGQEKANYSVYSVLLAKTLNAFPPPPLFLRVRNIYLSKYLLEIWEEWSKTRLFQLMLYHDHQSDIKQPNNPNPNGPSNFRFVSMLESRANRKVKGCLPFHSHFKRKGEEFPGGPLG